MGKLFSRPYQKLGENSVKQADGINPVLIDSSWQAASALTFGAKLADLAKLRVSPNVKIMWRIRL